MDDEFKLCWKNFQDNIASGFQNLYDRGDLVDVTLACDGKLLQAHKMVLAICSPYFQEIFITNPCKHPIIILKDVSFNIMCELLEFMYQGVVNVKHTELQTFMKIGQLLQIKGLATNNSTEKSSHTQNTTNNADDDTSIVKSNASNIDDNDNVNNVSSDGAGASSGVNIAADIDSNNSNNGHKTTNMSNTTTTTPPTSMPISAARASSSPLSFKSISDHHSFTISKRHAEFSSESLSIYSRKQMRRSLNDHSSGSERNDNSDTNMDQLNTEEFFLPAIPHISMVESRYDIKRETEHHGSPSSATSSTVSAAVASLRNTFPPGFSLDYNFYKNNNSNSAGNSNNGNSNSSGPAGQTGTEYPNELYMPNDYSKNFGNHMDIPPIAPGERWFQGKLEFMLSQRGKPLLVHDGHTFGIQYVRKDKKYWQCNLSRKFNCKARVTTTDTGEIIVTNNEHCHTEIRQHLRKDYQRNKVMMNALINLSTNRFADIRRQQQQHQQQQQQSLGGNLINLQGVMPTAGNLAPTSQIEEVVQNLHDLAAKATAEANERKHQMQLHQQQQQQQQQQQHQQILKYDDFGDDEPLDCGIKSTSMLNAACNFITNKNQNDNNDIKEGENWKYNKERIELQ